MTSRSHSSGTAPPPAGTRPTALDRSALGPLSSLPWRPSDTGIGAGASVTLDPLSEAGLERLAETLAGTLDAAVFVTRCSWCHRFDVEGWCDAATAAVRLRARDPELVPTITHGICESCTVAFEQAL